MRHIRPPIAKRRSLCHKRLRDLDEPRAAVMVSGNSIQKTSGCDACPAGAVSQQTIPSGDGHGEFTAQETTMLRAVRLFEDIP